jgi:hypothetical protein
VTVSSQTAIQQSVPTSVDVPIVFGLNTVTFAILGFLGKWAIDQVTKNSDRNQARNDREIQDLKDSQASFCDVYVRRDDFVRAMVSVDNKLDSIAKRQDEQFHTLLDWIDKE